MLVLGLISLFYSRNWLLVLIIIGLVALAAGIGGITGTLYSRGTGER